MIKLEVQEIYKASICRPDQLKTVENELTMEDIERLNDSNGWKYYREEDLIDTLLPELGDPLYFSSRFSLSEGKGIVVEIKGKRYRVNFEENDYDAPYEADGKTLILTPTTDPLSVPDLESDRYGVYYKFFGQPEWVQNEWFPADLNGNPCYHLLSIENGWGDMGNYNILIGFDENDNPNIAYFEASCS